MLSGYVKRLFNFKLYSPKRNNFLFSISNSKKSVLPKMVNDLLLKGTSLEHSKTLKITT